MRLLFLDDDALVARSLKRLLKLRGCEMLHVGTIDEAKAAVGNQAPFDAVLADLRLGSESGETFLVWIREAHPTVIRILTSGAACPPSYAISPPNDVFLLKPFEPGELLQLVEVGS